MLLKTAPTIFNEANKFHSVRNFVCPEPNLKDKLIVLYVYSNFNLFILICSFHRTIEHQKLIGCPVIIADQEKYKDNRNEFRFNACFIIPAQADALKYEVAVRKLAKYLRTLEVV